jgi:hypothetical protein
MPFMRVILLDRVESCAAVFVLVVTAVTRVGTTVIVVVTDTFRLIAVMRATANSFLTS